jgi:hypothetical protein
VTGLQVPVPEAVIGTGGGEGVAFLAFPQGALGFLALHGVTHCPQQQVAVHLALDQVVLGTGLDRVQGHHFVIGAGEHDDGHLGGVGEHGAEGLDAQAVGQGQVEQHDADEAA